MTDRELLELSAKAAGIPLCHFNEGKNAFWIDASDSWWNPLTDDGDALRLAVKLRLCIDNCIGDYDDRNDVCVANEVGKVGSVYADEDYTNDPYAATRRAVVRAAAEIGKGMK